MRPCEKDVKLGKVIGHRVGGGLREQVVGREAGFVEVGVIGCQST